VAKKTLHQITAAVT